MAMPPLRWLAAAALACGLGAQFSEAVTLKADVVPAVSGRRLRQAASQLQEEAASQLHRFQAASQLQVSGVANVTAGSFVRSLAFRHTLRVCNAYPSTEKVEVYQAALKITEAPLAYKGCEEFEKVQLQTGDRLLFKFGDGGVEGSFVVAELPNNDAVLMLVIYRHDATSTAAAFESHVFANLVNAQIAVLDTYKGAATSKAWIRDTAGQKTARNEELRYDSVVAVNAGIYDVALARGPSPKSTVMKKQLVALNRESYVVLRVGLQGPKGSQSYPEEVIVFPNSNPKALQSGALRSAVAVPFMTVLLAALLAVNF